MKKKHKKYIEYLNLKINEYQSRYRFWRVIAAISIFLNSFLIGFWIGKAIFQ